MKAQIEKEAMEESKYRELLEQERRDHELAVRLAQESNGQVEDSPPPVRRYYLALFLSILTFKIYFIIFLRFSFIYN